MSSTRNTNRKKIKILILDYDGCAATACFKYNGKYYPNKRADLLNQPMIDEAKKQGYAGFYGCTHRCIRTDFVACLGAENLNCCNDYIENFDPRNLFTTSITNNLVEALGLPLLAVSTPDDFSETAPQNDTLKQCGYGYENVIKPYEKQLLAFHETKLNAKDTEGYKFLPYDASSGHKGVPHLNGETKNPQLELIIKHAELLFPDCDIEFQYKDDLQKLCKQATLIKHADYIQFYATQLAPADEIDMRIYPDDIDSTATILSQLYQDALAKNSGNVNTPIASNNPAGPIDQVMQDETPETSTVVMPVENRDGEDIFYDVEINDENFKADFSYK